ncbi:MAG: hypothetical protein WCW13_03995, partial [archaeon]
TYGFESVRNNYARVGEPVYEVKKKLQNQPYSGETVREYNTLIELSPTAREMHFDGTIYIEDIEGFSHRPHAYAFIAEKKETLENTICDSMKQISHNQKYFYLTPSIYGLTFACAGFIKNEKQAKEAASKIVMTSEILEEKPTISLELFTPTVLEHLSAYRMNATKIANHLLGEKVVVGIDSKYSLKMLEVKGHQFMILNNLIEEYYPLNRELFSPTRGINLFVNINLEKIAEGNDEKQFFEKLSEVAEEVRKLKNKKKELLASKSYLKEFKFDEMKTAIGLTNFYKLSENFSGVKPIDFFSRIFKEITKLFEDDLLFGLGSVKAKEKFSEACGKEIFSQDTLAFEECLSSKKCCFTGKTASIKELNELIDKKVKQVEYIGL